MQNTINVTQEDAERGKLREHGHCSVAWPFKRLGGLMRTFLPALLFCLLTSVNLMSLSSVAFAQSDAQKSFEKLKTLAGSWEGRVTTVPQQAEVEGKYALVSLRITSMGNALLHEIKIEGRPDDPITMLYLEGDRLLLTHYCDAGNRPRMAAKVSADGKTVEFGFLDVVGSTRYGNMHDAAFTLIDVARHTEDWTWMGPEGKPVHVRFDLQRKK